MRSIEFDDAETFYVSMEKPASPFFGELVDNAFGFLERAIDQFKREPKYSIINFCSAVELLLKARLMHEHWSLIIDTGKGHPDLNAFKRGDFKSINFVDLIPRIKAVTGTDIPPDAVQCFEKLAKHRNKMIHFFHEAHTLSASEKAMEDIAIEQSYGWFYLQRLLKTWDNVFSPYNSKLSRIGRSMKDHKIYLDTVFERIKSEIIDDKKKGAVFVSCKMCKKKASEETKETDFIFNYKCRVCSFEDGALRIPCKEEECTKYITFEFGIPDQRLHCESCDFEMYPEDVANELDTEISDYGDHTRKNCAMCSGMDTVVQHEGYYVCTNCFYFTKEYGVCGWCNEGQIGGGDLEDSGWGGCEFCDGHAGHMRDKDD